MIRPLVAFLLGTVASIAFAASGDPQLMTDHPWYPGELACSTFERLFKTQAEAYKRATGRAVETDEDKALASWYWRNLHFAHGEEGLENCFAQGFAKGGGTREYWTGLFAHGFALCGTTHAQYTAEMEYLLGHCRGRVVGVSGHNSFEAFLTGGAYGEGRWALLDHDVSTVIYSPDGSRLLSIPEVKADLKTLKNPNFKPERQHGWRVAGLHDDDAGAYSAYSTAEYANGYAAVPPTVHLRAGESLRRYFKPGLEDGKTFVYWGRNYNTGGIPGPERSRAWVNQPEKMFNSKKGTGFVPGQVRYANAVYTYTPDFKSGAYKEGVIDESDKHVTFEFYTPYIIASTPASNTKPWSIYDSGGTNGLVLNGKFDCAVSASVDQGKTWQPAGTGKDGLDLTDIVKGCQQYWIRFDASPAALADSKLSMRTVCECNVAILPRLRDGENKITFSASGNAVVSVGPLKDQAEARVVDGKFGSKSVTLELAAPRKEKAVRLYAASWQGSGSPPAPVKYQIDYSVDGGKTWAPVVKDWQIQRRAPEPGDFWSQSMTYGDCALPDVAGPVRVRFTNDGGKNYLKAEAHLVYKVTNSSAVKVTFNWNEGAANKSATHTFPAAPGKDDANWSIKAGEKTDTLWVDYEPAK